MKASRSPTLCGRQLDVLIVEPALERRQIGSIRGERVRRQPAFHPDRIQKAIDRSRTAFTALGS
jgi:hypothetical protein